MSGDTSAFGSTLKALREAAAMTQQQLADKAGMHRFGIAKLEQGVRQPSWDTVQALAAALGVDCTAFAAAQPVAQAAKPGRPRKAEPEPPPAKKKGRTKK
jgi:transcriptional regulator with XRE-family HTH domain